MVTVSLALSVPAAVTEVAIWVAMVGDTWLTEITSLARPGVGGVVLEPGKVEPFTVSSQV